MTAEQPVVPDCKELPPCTELIICATNSDETTFVNTIVRSTDFSTLVFRTLNHYHHVSSFNLNGTLTIQKPDLNSFNYVPLDDSEELRGYLPHIIFTHDGRVFADSELYFGEHTLFNLDELESHVRSSMKNIPQEMVKRFDYLK